MEQTKEITLLQADYYAESLNDLAEDVYNAINCCSQIPKDEYGMHEGTFKVTITWSKE